MVVGGGGGGGALEGTEAPALKRHRRGEFTDGWRCQRDSQTR